MAPRGDFERRIPRWSLKRTSRAGAKQDQSWSLHRVEPLVVRNFPRTCDSQFCQPLMRLIEPENLKDQPADSGDSLPGPKDNKDVVEVPPTPPTSTIVEELIVPDSPEETWAGIEPSCRSGKLRKASARRLHADLVKVSKMVSLDSVDRPESTGLRASKHNGKRSFENASVHQYSDHAQQSYVRAPILAREKTTSTISQEPIATCCDLDLDKATGLTRQPSDSRTANFANAAASLSASSSFAASGTPVAASSISLKTARLPCGEDELEACSSITWPRHQAKDAWTPRSTNADNAVQITTFTTASGKPLSVSSVAMKKARALLGDVSDDTENCAEFAEAGYQRKVPMYSMPLNEERSFSRGRFEATESLGAGHGYERNTPHNMLTPLLRGEDDSAPITPFLRGSGKPLSVSSVGMTKMRTIFGDDDSREANDWDECAGAGYPRIRPRNIQTPLLRGNDDSTPIISFVTGSGKPVSVSSLGMTKARLLFENDDVREAKLDECGGARYPMRPPRNVMTPPLRANDDSGSITSFVTGSGKPVSVSSMGMTKAKMLFGDDDFREGKTLDECAGTIHERSPPRNIQTPLLRDHAAPLSSSVIGSGKPVSVSTTGMPKARILFGDDDFVKGKNFDECAGVVHPRSPSRNAQIPLLTDDDDTAPLTSFVTGSGKPLFVSSLSMQKARTLFGDDDFQEKDNCAESASAGYHRNLAQDVQIPRFEDTDGAVPTTPFVAGKAKPLHVSSMGLTKVTSFGEGVQATKNSSVPGGTGYQRNLARDARILLFKDTVSKAEALRGNPVMEDSTAGAVPLTTFSTASGKPISVSHSAMKKAKALLRDDEEENDDYAAFPTSLASQFPGQMINKNRIVLGNSTLSMTRFHTGNGACPPKELENESVITTKKAVSVTFVDTEKGDYLHEDDEKENHVGCGKARYRGNLQHCQDTNNSEFSAENTGKFRTLLQNAAERPISQSKATAEGQQVLPADVKDDGSPACHSDRSMQIPRSPSFRTPTGRIVTVSDEAILKAKVLLADGERKVNANETFGVNEPCPSRSRWYTENSEDLERKPTFQTGSGRTVAISREAIKKSRCLVPDGESNRSCRESTHCYNSAEHVNTQVASLTTPFRTSSGRRLTVSSQAMSRAKVLLAPHQSPLPAYSPAPDRGLIAADCMPEESLTSRYEDPGGGGTATTMGHGFTPPSHSFEMNRETMKLKSGVTGYRDSKVEQSKIVAKPHSTARGDNQLKNVRAFKPPRCVRNQPDVSVTCRENRSMDGTTSTSASSERNHSVLSRSTYLQNNDGTGRSGWMKLREYSEGPRVHDFEGLYPSVEVMFMTADAAESYRIHNVTEDGIQESVGCLEAWKLILRLGADSRQASKEWVANHYKWVVWKLASYERRYPQKAAGKLLTLDTVLYELKCRYDKELSGRRSAIRRITEGDSVPSRSMVLCVSAIRHNGDNEPFDKHTGQMPIDMVTSYNAARKADAKQQTASQTAKIEVTDGWYRLNAVLDAPLTKQLQRGKLKMGQKLQVRGASLSGRPDGTSPLEAFQDSLLKLHMNGTYRVPRDQRLGFCRSPSIPLAFKCIKPDGGIVAQTYVGVTRVYPILFKETSDQGISVVRSTRAEDLALNQFEHRRAKVLDETIRKLENSYDSSISHEEKNEEDKLFVAVENAAEPDILMADMTPAQHKAFAVYQSKKDTSRQAAIENAVKEALREAGLDSRNVKRVLKVRVTGLKCRGVGNREEGIRMKEGTITIWDVGDEQYIQEGSVYCVSGLKPAAWASTRNQDQLQLNSSSYTKWIHVPEAVYEKQFLFPYARRAPTRLSELEEKFVNREFDVAAMVLQVGEPFTMGSFTNQWVFMTDGSTAKNCPRDTWDETQLLAVRVNVSSQAFVPVEDSIVGSVIGYCNLLQQPKDHNRHLWVAEASETAIFSSNLTYLPMRHLQTAASCVSKWAQSTPWMADDLRYTLQTLMCPSMYGA